MGDAEKTLSEDKSGQVLAVSVRLVNEGRIGIPQGLRCVCTHCSQHSSVPGPPKVLGPYHRRLDSTDWVGAAKNVVKCKHMEARRKNKVVIDFCPMCVSTFVRAGIVK